MRVHSVFLFALLAALLHFVVCLRLSDGRMTRVDSKQFDGAKPWMGGSDAPSSSIQYWWNEEKLFSVSINFPDEIASQKNYTLPEDFVPTTLVPYDVDPETQQPVFIMTIQSTPNCVFSAAPPASGKPVPWTVYDKVCFSEVSASVVWETSDRFPNIDVAYFFSKDIIISVGITPQEFTLARLDYVDLSKQAPSSLPIAAFKDAGCQTGGDSRHVYVARTVEKSGNVYGHTATFKVSFSPDQPTIKPGSKAVVTYLDSEISTFASIGLNGGTQVFFIWTQKYINDPTMCGALEYCGMIYQWAVSGDNGMFNRSVPFEPNEDWSARARLTGADDHILLVSEIENQHGYTLWDARVASSDKPVFIHETDDAHVKHVTTANYDSFYHYVVGVQDGNSGDNILRTYHDGSPYDFEQAQFVVRDVTKTPCGSTKPCSDPLQVCCLVKGQYGCYDDVPY
eukprot:TRINITY_DN82_c1_g2_i1.p1 TRINITY_DN82_c1_g2~~TRINITY_DN82_c1_g2_i1.p1  ORF type:complete len:481 (+),score=91.53 TRINITY_DN82_c1_g2_i1:85-1443(+)